MDAEKIVEYRGIRGLVAAKLTKDTSDELKYDTPFALAGASELSKETESSSDTHYYDNEAAIVINVTGADAVNVNTSAVSLKNRATITGQKYDEGTGALIEGTPKPPYMAIGYITEDTDGREYYVWRLKGKFSDPSDSHKSKDNGTDANGQELTYTGVNTKKIFESNDASGKPEPAKATIVPADSCGMTEEQFFSKVQTPDDIIKTTPSGEQTQNAEENPAG